MKKIVSAFALSLLVTLGCEKEEDGPKKTYMYINLYNLGREMDYLKNFSPDVYSYEDVGFLSASVSAIKIKRFWLKDSEGHTVEVDPKKIYTQTPAVPSGFDATTPIELPPYDYSRYGIEVENVTTQTELKASGSVINTAISKNSTTAPAEGSVINLYPTQQFDPITISGKVIGSDGPVYRLTLFVNANVEQTSTTTNGIKTVSQKLSYYLLNNSDLINPKKKPGIEGCIEWAWTRTICNGTKIASVYFKDGVGKFLDFDCNNIATCSSGRYFEFTYKIKSNTEMEITYTTFKICNIPQPTFTATQPFSCNGNTLVFGNTYTK